MGFQARPYHCGLHLLKNTPEWIRTIDLRFRKPPLYPTELREQVLAFIRLREFCCNRRFTVIQPFLQPRRKREPKNAENQGHLSAV